MKTVGVLLSEGFEEIEALTVVDVLRRANVKCNTISLEKIDVCGAHNICIKTDEILDESAYNYDMIILPGGMPGAKNLRDSLEVIKLVQHMNKENKFIGAICAAPIVLEKAGIIEGRNITSYPNSLEDEKRVNYKTDNVVIDKNIITSRGPSTALEFSYEILKMLGYEKEAVSLEKGMLFKS